jgi:hypothetical protein
MDLRPQEPAEGILKSHDWGNSKMYHIVCTCGNSDDAIEVEIEADQEVTVTHYVTVKTDWWTETIEKRYDIDNEVLQEIDWFAKNFINGLITRIKLTWSIWVHGYLKYQATTVMSEQQAINYAETLKSASKDVKEFQNQKAEKTNGKNKENTN